MDEQKYKSISPDAWHKTLCPYCGVGCGLRVGVFDDKVVRVHGDNDHPSTQGMLCKKPLYLPDALKTDDRILYPQLRVNQDEEFTRVTWDETMAYMAEKVKQVVRDHGPDAVAFYGSGQFSTEDYYTINKLLKGFIGTNNFDANSRLCMASAVVGYVSALGSDGPPPSYSDIRSADCFFLIGTNTAECHPVVFNRIKMRKKGKRDAVIICVDPRETQTAKASDLHLPIRPGTDVALLNGMLHVIEREGLLDHDFIQNHTEGFVKALAVAKFWPPEKAAAVCGIGAELIEKAALAFGTAENALSFWSMGVNQSTVGVEKNHGIINLHLATGKIGREGSGPFSLTGQPNAMGGREAGGLAHILPGYRLIGNETHRQEVEDYWGIPQGQINPKPGLPAVEMFEAAARGDVKVLWIACTNPAVSMPNIDVVEAAFRKAELVIVQDAYHPTDTTQFAHILLPAAQWSEKAGIMTNSERRITLLPKMVSPPGEALPDWKIFARFAEQMGYGYAFDYETHNQVFDEFKGLTKGRVCDYSGVNRYRLIAEGPLQWPVPDLTHPGTKSLYTDHEFPTASGRANFFATPHKDFAEQPDEAYPYILNTGRLLDQWHTMTRTGKAPQLLKAYPEPFVEIHPTDAELIKINDGEMVKLVTRRGEAEAKAKITDRIRQGSVFMPFHWGRMSGELKAANNLTSDAVDPRSKEPELKACAVNLIPIPKQIESPEKILEGMQTTDSSKMPVAGD